MPASEAPSASSVKPCISQPCGERNRIVPRRPACEIGKNVPPSSPPTTATIETVRAGLRRGLGERRHERRDPDRGQHAAEHQRGDPERVAPLRAAGATSRRSPAARCWSAPTVKLASALPPITDAGLTGATSRRESVPSSRSSSRPRTPNSTAKNRKNTAMPIAKNVDCDVRLILRGRGPEPCAAAGTACARASRAGSRRAAGSARPSPPRGRSRSGSSRTSARARRPRAIRCSSRGSRSRGSRRPGPACTCSVNPAGKTNAASMSPSSASVSAVGDAVHVAERDEVEALQHAA